MFKWKWDNFSKYFSREEFKCKCGCGKVGNNPQAIKDVLKIADAIRESVDKPIRITSGYRCPKHNKASGGVPNSWHTQGCAVDLVCDYPIEDFAKLAERFGAHGVGRYFKRKFVHVDVGGGSRRWSE